MVPPVSVRIPRVPTYSGTASRCYSISPTGLSPCLADLPRSFGYLSCNTLHGRPTTPCILQHTVWAPPRSLAATGGISIDFYSCWYLDGSVPNVFRMHTILLMYMHMSSRHMGYPIRTSADRWILAPPRSFSQLITSFFAWQLLGILRRPYFRLTILFFQFLH